MPILDEGVDVDPHYRGPVEFPGYVREVRTQSHHSRGKGATVDLSKPFWPFSA